MSVQWSGASIRVKLTSWYAAVLALMLIVYAAATFLAVRHEFSEQFDQELHDDLEAAESLLMWTPDGRLAASGSGDHDPDATAERAYDVWSVNGERLYRSGPPVALPPAVAPPAQSHGEYASIDVNGQQWRTVTATTMVGGRAVVLRASRSAERLRGQLWEIVLVLVVGLPLVVVLSGIGGYALARRALAPIDHLASEAQRITADRLHQRVSAPNQGDEIGRLAAVINDTFARLESSFDQLRRFTADASHELRTPLAVVRGLGEAAVAERREPAEYQEVIGSMLEEVDRMTQLVDTLLRLSRADAGTIRLSLEPLDLAQLTRDVTSSLSLLAEERNQTLTLDATDGIVASGDRLVLREAITNLLDNAIKYGPAGSTIALRVDRVGDRAVVAIADEGPGVAAEYRERIFHRFFRVDEARSRDHGGAGLGLAIAKWAVELHGGQIAVVSRSGGGSEFRIELPMTQPAAPTRNQQTVEVAST